MPLPSNKAMRAGLAAKIREVEKQLADLAPTIERIRSLEAQKEQFKATLDLLGGDTSESKSRKRLASEQAASSHNPQSANIGAKQAVFEVFRAQPDKWLTMNDLLTWAVAAGWGTESSSPKMILRDAAKRIAKAKDSKIEMRKVNREISFRYSPSGSSIIPFANSN